MERQNFFAWSIPVGSIRGVPIRIDWTLIVVEIFATVGCFRSHLLAFLPVALAVPVLSVALHAWVHALAARLVGGRMQATTLWALGDFSQFDLPIAPWPQFATAAAGPLVGAAIFGAMTLALGTLPPLIPAESMFNLSYAPLAMMEIGSVNLGLALWNLIPSSMFDGGRLWRALLWPMLGLRRAMRFSIYGGFAASAVLVVLGVWAMSLLGLIFGVILLMVTFYEHRSLQMGQDVVFGIDPTYANAYRREERSSWFARWRERREEQRQVRLEQEEAREQEVLDRLLAKVSAEGLPSLTAAERAELHRISEKQKKRLERA